MNIRIQSAGFTAKEELTAFIKEKSGRLFNMYDKIIRCEVVLQTDKAGTKNNKVCDIRLIIPGNDLLAGAQCITFEESAKQAIDALVKQLEKRKTITTQPHKQHN